jgi:hypothetical protein
LFFAGSQQIRARVLAIQYFFALNRYLAIRFISRLIIKEI